MFITNKLTPIELLSELLDRRGYRAEATQEFRELRHNNDLCPRFADNAKAALEAYLSHHANAQDVQGIKDEGIDVVMKFSWDGVIHKAGLQIKSFKEIEDWATKKNKKFMENLKAQSSSALNKINVDPYYIVLCTDELKHRDQLRLIKSEFMGYERVKIIEPREALAFYKMGGLDVLITVTRLLCDGDSVLNASLAMTADMPCDEAFVLIHAFCKAFEQNLRITSDDIFEIYSEWNNRRSEESEEEDNLATIVSSLDRVGIIQDDTGDFQIELHKLPLPLCALYFDQRFRHERQAHQMADYLCALLDIA